MIKELKIPKDLGAVADLYGEARAARLTMQKEVEALEEKEKTLRAYLIDNLPKSKAEGITGKKWRATISVRTVPTAENWDSIQKYIKKNDAFDLLQRRLSPEAVTARWEAGKTIPGVGKIDVKSISLNKR